jgi:ubiquinone/menaquinone biosynthesis C-methylase UbiE
MLGYSTLVQERGMQTGRKEFLRMMAAATLLARGGKAAPQQAASPATGGTEQFAERVLEDCGAAFRCALCNIGDRLGIFKTMAASGPVTAPDLARKTSFNARMLREWLNAMAAANYIAYRPSDKTYLLPKEHAPILADEETSPMFIGGMFQLLVPMVASAPKVAGAFQSGKPVTMYDFSADLYQGMERASAPGFRHQLVQKWIPLLTGIEEVLRSGGNAVDVGCGTGLASIVLAKAFPKSRFVGYDPYAPSIRRAREHASKEGVADRVQFVIADSSKLQPAKFDLVTIFNSVHHFSEPVKLLTHCRKALKAGGTCFIVDADLSVNPEDNMNIVGRVFYPATTLWCLQDSMASNGAGLGSEFGEAVLKDLASKSGFTQCKKLDGSTPLEAYYDLRS